MNSFETQAFAPDLHALLAPIAGEQPAGLSMRYDPSYLVIRQAREQDDPTLPRGEWVRDLKKADWSLAASTSIALLTHKTKDFQLAAWLCEAWIHLHGLEGLNAAIQLLQGLLDGYWEQAYPQIDDGDEDARLAPFVWMNENIPLVLNLQVPLLFLPERKRAAVSLADWDKTLTPEAPSERSDNNSASAQEKALIRDDILAAAQGANLSRLVQIKLQISQALSGWAALARHLDSRVQSSPPSIARVTEVLRRLERAVTTLLDGRGAAEAVPVPVATLAPAAQTEDVLMNHSESTPSAPRTASPDAQGQIENREDAYRRLEQIAQYLMKHEPHSPTPYLIKRAVSWGRMSLVDLMHEVVREEGDMSRYLSLLGIKDQSDSY
jgi:type VI secretion system protein ImpA